MTQLLTCTLCCSTDRTTEDTYGHMFCRCPIPLPVLGRQASRAALAQYSLDSDLEQHLIPHVTECVCSADGHQIRLGNWSSTQLKHLSTAWLPTDFYNPLTTFSHQLGHGKCAWAKYLEAADSGLLQYFQRKFKPYYRRLVSEPKLFYGVRLGHVPWVYAFPGSPAPDFWCPKRRQAI